MANVILNQTTQTNLHLKQEPEQTSYLNKAVRVVRKVIKVYPFYLAFKGCKFLFNYCVHAEVPAKILIPQAKSNGVKQLDNPEPNDNSSISFDGFLQKSLAIKPNIQITDKQLGKGENGKVMLARLYDEDTKTHKDVAVKILYKDKPENTYESFKNEVATGLALKKVKDTFTETIAAFEDNETNSFQIVMELADIDFSNAIDLFKDSDGKLPMDIIGNMLVSTAQLIKIILICNIWYSDLHGGNRLLFFKQDKIKICDFGMCSINDKKPNYQQINLHCNLIGSYNESCLELNKNYGKNLRLNRNERFDDIQKEACKNYFLVEIEKSSITEEDKALLIKSMDELFVSNCHVLRYIGTLLSIMCSGKNIYLAPYIIDGYIKFVKDNIGYRETFVEDAQKIYQDRQSNSKY
jgi:hypothetical protein